MCGSISKQLFPSKLYIAAYALAKGSSHDRAGEVSDTKLKRSPVYLLDGPSKPLAGRTEAGARTLPGGSRARPRRPAYAYAAGGIVASLTGRRRVAPFRPRLGGLVRRLVHGARNGFGTGASGWDWAGATNRQALAVPCSRGLG